MAVVTLQTLFRQLNQLRSTFGEKQATQKEHLLQLLSTKKIATYRDIQTYHDMLLFIAAYPDNFKIWGLAKNALNKLTGELQRASRLHPKKFDDFFEGTGIAYSTVQWNVSFEGCEWLLKQFEEDVKLVWDDTFTSNLGAYLAALCSPTEQDSLIDNRFDAKDWLLMASGKKTTNSDLIWLINKLRNVSIDKKIRDHYYEALGIEITLRLSQTKASITRNVLDTNNIFFQKGDLLKRFEIPAKINESIPYIKELKGKEKQTILNSSKAVLAARERETDPVFYAQHVYKVTVERGLDVYLFIMDFDHMLPIETYAGFVSYRNGVPIGYGGGWIFIDRCEIGVNIFETFRGGENNLIFTNIMRVYKQVFEVSKFVVQPYQFGEDNDEGLQSGAFWFYYKLGFRPSDKNINLLAEKEWTKLTSRQGYRTPISILKKFTESPVAITFEKSKVHFEPKTLSVAITRFVALKFNGDLKAANMWSKTIIQKFKSANSMNLWTALERKAFDGLSILVAVCSLTVKFTSKEQESIIQLVKKKGTDEISFAKGFSKSTVLLNALNKFIKKYDLKE